MKFYDTALVPLIFYGIQTIQALVMTFEAGMCVCAYHYVCYVIMYSIKYYVGYCTPYQFELLVAAPEHIPLSSCGPLKKRMGTPVLAEHYPQAFIVSFHFFKLLPSLSTYIYV